MSLILAKTNLVFRLYKADGIVGAINSTWSTIIWKRLLCVMTTDKLETDE